MVKKNDSNINIFIFTLRNIHNNNAIITILNNTFICLNICTDKNNGELLSEYF